ncbi:MAG: hypothetical protein VX208_00340, partial [SAR324 cluster bacterium]|nr:hypothetical protein [SAR324 cluster bacterium]
FKLYPQKYPQIILVGEACKKSRFVSLFYPHFNIHMGFNPERTFLFRKISSRIPEVDGRLV